MPYSLSENSKYKVHEVRGKREIYVVKDGKKKVSDELSFSDAIMLRVQLEQIYLLQQLLSGK